MGTPTRHETEQLAIVRELLRRAGTTTTERGPTSALGLLGLQDAVEWFLWLSCEHLGADPKPRTAFEDYFELIDNQLPQGVSLQGRARMTTLNKARVGLKHYGVRPSGEDLARFVAHANEFFAHNVPRVLDVAFEDIDLAQLVAFEPARITLERSALLTASGDILGALEGYGVAFAQVLDEFRRSSSVGRFARRESIVSPSVDSDVPQSDKVKFAIALHVGPITIARRPSRLARRVPSRLWM